MLSERSGLFETLRVENGKAVFPELHFKRLMLSCRKLSIPVPKLSVEEFVQKVESFCNHPVSLVRFTIYSSGSFSTSSRRCEEKSTVSLLPYEKVKRVRDELSLFKTTDTFSSIFAAEEVRRKGFDEAVLFDPFGFVSEACFANIFFVKNGVFFTPSLETGCLPGTRRWLVMKILEKMGVPCIEGFYRLSDLLSADEVMLTSSRYDVVRVERIGDREFEKRGTPWALRLKEAMEELRKSGEPVVKIFGEFSF